MSESIGKPCVVVVGNGMVGCKFLEKLVDLGGADVFDIIAIGEEPQAAYDRVRLSAYFDGATVDELTLKPLEWYSENKIELRLSTRVDEISRDDQQLRFENGDILEYDFLILATGSYPFVPPIPGNEKEGVFVYRTIEDLDAITEYAKSCKHGTVLGGGLLGLEAANAVLNLGLKTSVVEFAPRLMPRQLDDAGAEFLKSKIEELDIEVLVSTATKNIDGDGAITSLTFSDDTSLSTDMLVISAGIRPRDSLARDCGLAVGERGGVIVDEFMRTSDPLIYAIGEVALLDGMIYGLVAPGYDMADVVANLLMAEPKSFNGADMSTKLKLLGVDVASFGDAMGATEGSRSLVLQNAHEGIYKRLNVNADGTKLLGGILVGDAEDYNSLLQMVKNEMVLPPSPEGLLLGSSAAGSNPLADMELPDSAQVCSCENVSKGEIRACIRNKELLTIGDVKRETKAGTGCGGCGPLVTSIFKDELAAMGKTLTNHMCEHFPYTRTELFNIIKIKNYSSFSEVLAEHGTGAGCEICKPTVASCIASLYNEPAFHHDTIQDTNDKFMANIQRGGTYSVIPRIPGGEITPDKLIVLGQVAKKYNLYTKITGGQRIDLLGARVEQLPDIWEELVAVGFESGHAYAKGLRTVKSCVGTSWCRFAVGNSVDLAIKVENRYKGLRSPHKLKSAVSGCIRECAEAQSKDFGIIATDKGWNLYVCGNGGAQPRHADLLAIDLDEETLIKYIDRFLMYYIQTADKLQRTARWLENLEGGVNRLKEIIVDDALGLAEDLEAEMEKLVGIYVCEWTALVNNPTRKEQFRHFVNSPSSDANLEFLTKRDQKRPVPWPIGTGNAALPVIGQSEPTPDKGLQWVSMAEASSFPKEGGACVKYKGRQIAVFHFESQDRWYATQNLCPHKKDMVLSRGIIGSSGETLKVACPQHKKTFDLETGEGLSDPSFSIETYDVKIQDGQVWLNLPVAWKEGLPVESETCESEISTEQTLNVA